MIYKKRKGGRGRGMKGGRGKGPCVCARVRSGLKGLPCMYNGLWSLSCLRWERTLWPPLPPRVPCTLARTCSSLWYWTLSARSVLVSHMSRPISPRTAKERAPHKKPKKEWGSLQSVRWEVWEHSKNGESDAAPAVQLSADQIITPIRSYPIHSFPIP